MGDPCFRLLPYVFLVEGKGRGALYDLHGARIFPIPEALTQVLIRCNRGTPVEDIKTWAGKENEAAVDGYFSKLIEMNFGKFYTDVETYEKVGLQLPRLRFHTVDELTISPTSAPSDLSLSRWLEVLKAFRQQCGSFKLQIFLEQNFDRQLLLDLLADEALANYRVSLLLPPAALSPKDIDWVQRLGIPIQRCQDLSGSSLPVINRRRLVCTLESFRHLSALNINANRFFIQGDGQVYPCYHHRDLCLGSLKTGQPRDLVAGPKVQRFWRFTKDQVDVCRDCEFRYGCPNPQRGTVSQLSVSPRNCNYSPETGVWKQDRLWQFFESAISGSPAPEVEVLETTHFRVFCATKYPFPREYLPLLTGVVERASTEFGLDLPSRPIAYCYYPHPSEFPDMVVEAAGGIMEATPIDEGFRLVIHTCLPCHSHEILHALLHPLNPGSGTYFVREAAATVLGLADGLDRDRQIDPLASQIDKLTLLDGRQLPENALLLDHNGLISGPLRKDPHVHSIAAGLLAIRGEIDLNQAFSALEIKDLAMYLLGGSFMHYLKDRRGVDAFLAFYRSSQRKTDLPMFRQLQSDWIQMLKERWECLKDK